MAVKKAAVKCAAAKKAPAKKKPDPNRKLRCGVVGLGIGQCHVAGYRSHPNAELVAVADIDPVRLEEIGNKKLNVAKRYSTLTEMLANEDLDIVSIATPNKFHAPLTIEALKAGCHVLCEKPMAMNVKEAEEMIKVAKSVGKRIMIDFSYRTSEQSVALKRAVESGTLGDIYYARTQWLRRRGAPLGTQGWFRRKELSGGGPLLDLGVHRLDLALWLMNYPKPVWVMGSAYNHLAQKLQAQDGHQYDVEDLAVALVKFENGATLEVEASWLTNIRENELMSTRLLGTKAGLLQHNKTDGADFGGYTFDAEIFTELAGCQYDMKLHPPVPAATSHFYNFVDAILNDKPHDATGEQGLLVMQILEAIYKSAKTGKPVQIK